MWVTMQRGDDFDDEREYEADQEAAADEYYEQIGEEWAENHPELLAERFFAENYEEAVEQFTSERLQSYYLEQPELAVPALNALRYAQSLMPAFHQAALVFAVTATELAVKDVLLKPIISGLVHIEDLASLVADLTTKHSGMDRFQNLLTEILAQFGGVDLKVFKRPGATKGLWQEMNDVQKARNAVVHRGQTVDADVAVLSINVGNSLLNDIFPQVLSKLRLHLQESRTIQLAPKKT